MTNRLEVALRGRLGTFELDVEFQLDTVETSALFGPSGSGKTSILRCVAGLQRLPGRVRFNDELWQDESRNQFVEPPSRRIGYVFQESNLFSHLDVRANLMFGFKRSARRHAPSFSFDSVIDMLRLSDLLERRPGVLSGGERQRVALGRALLSQPQLLLMDEPLSALDRQSRNQILPYLEALREQFNVPMLYVSHDIAEVARLADRMVLLANGKKVAEGAVQSVLERLDLGPSTGRFEAGVVLNAEVVGHDREFHLSYLQLLQVTDQRLCVPLVRARIGENVRLRLRARDVSLSRLAPEAISIRNILKGNVEAIVEEPGSAFAETLVELGGAKVRARITRAAVHDLELRVGAPVYVLIKSVAFDRPVALGSGIELDGSRQAEEEC